MAKKTPLVKDNVLEVREVETGRLIYRFDISKPAEWKYWQAFLDNEKSFRYVWTSPRGFTFTYSGYKEKRTHKYGQFYIWIAHKRVGGQLRRKYLGANCNLTAKKLQETAEQISQGQR